MPKKTKHKILIVEDDEDFLSILKIKFESEGFSVVSAADGEEGALMAGEEKPDLVISDVLIPKMDGVEMARKIKKIKNGPPVVFLTNIKDDNYIDNMKKLDCDYWVKSDLRINEIVEKVRVKLGLK